MKFTKALLKPVALDLMKVIKPLDDDDQPLDLNKGTLKEIKASIKECAECLESGDKITDETREALVTLGFIEAPAEPKGGKKSKEKVEDDTADLTWKEINGMDRKELETLCKERPLISTSDDYDQLLDFKIDVAVELKIEVPKKDMKKAAGADEKPTVKKDKKVEADNTALVNAISLTKKLKDLKEICGDNEDTFESLDLDEYKGLGGLKELRTAMLGLTGALVDQGETEKEKPKPKTDKAPKTSTTKTKPKERREYIKTLIEAEKYTMAQIIEKVGEKFPDVREVTVKTQLTDAKNVKYCPYDSVAIVTDGIFSFSEDE